MPKSHVAPKNLVVKIESADVVNDGMRQTSHVVPKKLVVKTQSADVAQDSMRPKSHVVSNNLVVGDDVHQIMPSSFNVDAGVFSDGHAIMFARGASGRGFRNVFW